MARRKRGEGHGRSIFGPAWYEKPPWWRHHRKPPTQYTLRRWRRYADDVRAAEIGAKWMCHICKRPLGEAGGQGTYGSIVWEPPAGNRHDKKWRRICLGCWAQIDQFIYGLELQGCSDHLPPEIL